MENRKITTYMIGLALLLTSCVKDELYNTPHPEMGAVRVTTDWSGISEDAAQPTSYLLRIGETTQAASATENTFKQLLPTGTYSILVQNTPHGITVGATTATVSPLPDRTLEPMPEYLFSAVQPLNVIKDDTLNVNIKMIQSIRTLNLTLKLQAGDAARIASTTATLTGVANTIDLATGTCNAISAGITVKPQFRLSTVAPTRVGELPALIATVRLAGVVNTSKQLLALTVTLTGGTTQTIETNLTEALNNFATSIEPITLNATLTLPNDEQTEGNFSGTITDWTVVENGNFPIH